jgi:hypothetical protein
VLVFAIVYAVPDQRMAAVSPPSEWILLGSTVVRKEDIRRIDVSTEFGLIFNVYVQYGPSIRIRQSDHGSQWLYEQYLAAREAVSAPQRDTPSSDTE